MIEGGGSACVSRTSASQEGWEWLPVARDESGPHQGWDSLEVRICEDNIRALVCLDVLKIN